MRSPAAAIERLHFFGYAHGFDADGDDAGEEGDHRVLVVGEAVAVEFFADGRVSRGLFLVLVEHPVDGAAVAEAIVPCGAGDAAELGVFIDHDNAGFGQALEPGLGVGAVSAFGVGWRLTQ